MEEFQIARDKARKNIQAADHIAFMTYPLVKNNRLLLVIIEHLFLAMTNTMGAILRYEEHFGRAPSFKEDYETKRKVFMENCSRKYNINYDYIELMDDIKEILVRHKNSPMEFTRKDAFVICSEDYRTKVINIEKIKEYIFKAKRFISEMETITSRDVKIKEVKNERIFR